MSPFDLLKGTLIIPNKTCKITGIVVVGGINRNTLILCIILQL